MSIFCSEIAYDDKATKDLVSLGLSWPNLWSIGIKFTVNHAQKKTMPYLCLAPFSLFAFLYIAFLNPFLG